MTTDSGAKISESPQPPAAETPLSVSSCEPYREMIEEGLGRGRNAMGIWQDLVDKHGYSGGYQTVKRFVRKLRGPHFPQAVGIILTAPGEEAQVDYVVFKNGLERTRSNVDICDITSWIHNNTRDWFRYASH